MTEFGTYGGGMDLDLALVAGIPEERREAAAEVFWAGFRGKTHRVMGDDDRAKQFFATALTDEGTVLAVDRASGHVLGLMASTDRQHKAMANEWECGKAAYGALQAFWRLTLLSTVQHKPRPGELYVEFLAVAPQARGRGVGGVLLEYARQLAGVRGLDRVTLDVVDSNPRAKALYERSGFTTFSMRRMVPGSQWLFGFKSYDMMVRRLDPSSAPQG